MFDKKGYITLEPGKLDADDVFMVAVDAGADDVEIEAEEVEVYTPPTELHAVMKALEDEGVKVNEATLAQFAQNEIEIGVKETLSIMTLVDLLEDLDDVDKVYSNLKISDEALASLEAA